jgi:hypothetical protein
MGFGTQPDGDPIVFLPTSIGPPLAGLTYVLDGAGPGYHMYELVYDPVFSSADLYVDGVKRLSDYTGLPSPNETPTVSWGAGSSGDTGQGNYNLVQFAIVPEPSTVTLFGFALLSLCANRRVGPR